MIRMNLSILAAMSLFGLSDAKAEIAPAAPTRAVSAQSGFREIVAPAVSANGVRAIVPGAQGAAPARKPAIVEIVRLRGGVDALPDPAPPKGAVKTAPKIATAAPTDAAAAPENAAPSASPAKSPDESGKPREKRESQ